MCKGLYETGPPCQLFIEGVVGINSPASSGARTIRFLIDTGATRTMISATDAVRLWVSYDNGGRPHWNGKLLPYAGEATGVGGKLKLYYLDKTFVTLISHESSYGERHTEYITNLLVAEAKYEDESLLGMDLVQRFKLLIDSDNTIVDFTRIPVKGTSYLVQHT